jgi:hypothetical protein
MRLPLLVSAAIAILVMTVASESWAKRKGQAQRQDTSTAVPDSINRQFQWEDKVVGPKNKGVDHQKIAAMQEQARREDAARKKEPPRKAARPEGISAPASATPPTMDIEKPSANAPKKPAKKVVAEAPRRKDDIDNLLDEEGVKPGTATAKGSGGLGSILAVDDKPAASAAPTHAVVKKSKRPHRRRN